MTNENGKWSGHIKILFFYGWMTETKYIPAWRHTSTLSILCAVWIILGVRRKSTSTNFSWDFRNEIARIMQSHKDSNLCTKLLHLMVVFSLLSTILYDIGCVKSRAIALNSILRKKNTKNGKMIFGPVRNFFSERFHQCIIFVRNKLGS